MATQHSSLPPLQVQYEDDPRVVQEAATEDYSLHVVPLTWRMSSWSLSMAWFALFSAMFWVVVASTIDLAVGTVNTIIGMVLAVIVYGAINYVMTQYATRTGLTVAMFSRALFGYLGAALATLIFGATAIYYAVFEGSVIAVAFASFWSFLPLNIWYLVVVLYSVPLVIGGVRVWLDKFNGVLLPFYIIGLIAAVVWAIVKYGYHNTWLTYTPSSMAGIPVPGWWFAFTTYMGVWIMMMYTWDYARFGRDEDRHINGLVSFGPPFYLFTFMGNGLVGIFLAHTIPTKGPLSEISAVLGIVAMMGIFGVALIWVSQTRINTANFYLASTNLESFFSRVFKLKLPRTIWAVIVGAIVYLIMLTNVFSYILRALRWQGVFIVAWVGIALTHIAYDHFVYRRRHPEADLFEFRPGRVPRFNPAGLVAWFLASAVGIYLVEAGGPTGGVWSPPVTFVLSVVIYAIMLEVQAGHRAWYVMDRPYDPRGEVNDPWQARVHCAFCDRFYLAVEMDRDPSSGYKPICAMDASKSTSMYPAAVREARSTDVQNVEVGGILP